MDRSATGKVWASALAGPSIASHFWRNARTRIRGACMDSDVRTIEPYSAFQQRKQEFTTEEKMRATGGHRGSKWRNNRPGAFREALFFPPPWPAVVLPWLLRGKFLLTDIAASNRRAGLTQA